MFRRKLPHRRGQALVEFALVLPLFVMILTGIIILGIGVFYQQQVTNAAREAARYASIHSTSSRCPTISTLYPGLPLPGGYRYECDTPADRWPLMTAEGRSRIFGLPPANVQITPCWSGYVDDLSGSIDAPPDNSVAGNQSTWVPCFIDGNNPTTDANALGCSPDLATTDTASEISEGQGRNVANQVTAYACYEWSPPLAGFLLIPETVTLRGVVSEPIQRQQ
jgi:hypothetical protein